MVEKKLKTEVVRIELDKNCKVIGIIGSRRRNALRDFDKTKIVFDQVYKAGDLICSGGCPQGGDKFAEMLAKSYGIPILIFHADWNKHGKAAGFIRNGLIAKASDVLIAVVTGDRKGGTEDTIRKFGTKGEIHFA